MIRNLLSTFVSQKKITKSDKFVIINTENRNSGQDFIFWEDEKMEIARIEDIELEKYITEIMLDIGIPAHLKGYHYLRDSIFMSSKDMEMAGSVTKLLYPVVAKHFRTTDQKVERAIRNAIEVSWDRGNTVTFEKLFGYSSATGRPRPTNSEYIARIADKVRLDIKAM